MEKNICSFNWEPLSPVHLGRRWRHSRDKIDQDYPLCVCILQAIKKWKVWRPGNEATPTSHPSPIYVSMQRFCLFCHGFVYVCLHLLVPLLAQCYFFSALCNASNQNLEGGKAWEWGLVLTSNNHCTVLQAKDWMGIRYLGMKSCRFYLPNTQFCFVKMLPHHKWNAVCNQRVLTITYTVKLEL